MLRKTSRNDITTSIISFAIGRLALGLQCLNLALLTRCYLQLGHNDCLMPFLGLYW